MQHVQDLLPKRSPFQSSTEQMLSSTTMVIAAVFTIKPMHFIYNFPKNQHAAAKYDYIAIVPKLRKRNQAL